MQRVRNYDKERFKREEVKKIEELDIPRIKGFYKETHIRMYALLTIGIDLGLRISDLIKIKFEDITEENTVFLKEKKKDKKRMVLFNKGCMEMVKLLKEEHCSKGIPLRGIYLNHITKVI